MVFMLSLSHIPRRISIPDGLTNACVLIILLPEIEVSTMFHILVVDDDRSTRLFMRALLEAEGCRVALGADGEEALEKMGREQVDLAVVDIMMPRLDGYEFTCALRESNSDLPILMVSAKSLPADRKKGFQAGTDDFMVKPVDEEELLLHIHALLRRARLLDEPHMTVGSVTLDHDALSVTRGGETQMLPQKEFQLLYKLLSNPGRIFTRIELMDDIWGKDSETGWETVTVHIGRLRKRFEGWEDFEIVSVRGLGYKAVKKA